MKSTSMAVVSVVFIMIGVSLSIYVRENKNGKLVHVNNRSEAKSIKETNTKEEKIAINKNSENREKLLGFVNKLKVGQMLKDINIAEKSDRDSYENHLHNDVTLYLEELLLEEPENEEWTEEVKAAVTEKLRVDPEIEIESAKCSNDYCGVVLTKPIESALNWREIDEQLEKIAIGQTIIKAVPEENGQTMARIFFSRQDKLLPL